MIRSVVLFTHVIGMLVLFIDIAFDYDVIYGRRLGPLSQRCATHARRIGLR